MKMNCKKYDEYSLGILDEASFQSHLVDCAECRRNQAEDEVLFREAARLKQPVHAPLLWDKIENGLRNARQSKVRTLHKEFQNQFYPFLKIAAILILIFSVTLYVSKESPATSSKLLTKNLLKQVENKENDYIHAIEQLERLTKPKMEVMNPDLMLLYRDRLETIDAQIARCKEALAKNPANAHIRNYLFAALQDKKETLKEILKSEQRI
jgi:hypothetical protein